MTFDALVAVCGPRCTRCDAYQATRSGRAALARLAAEWTQAMGREFAPEDLICDGCRVVGGRKSAYCAECEILNCARRRGYETCAHCPDSPCEKLNAPPAIEAIAELKAALLCQNNKAAKQPIGDRFKS